MKKIKLLKLVLATIAFNVLMVYVIFTAAKYVKSQELGFENVTIGAVAMITMLAATVSMLVGIFWSPIIITTSVLTALFAGSSTYIILEKVTHLTPLFMYATGIIMMILTGLLLYWLSCPEKDFFDRMVEVSTRDINIPPRNKTIIYSIVQAVASVTFIMLAVFV